MPAQPTETLLKMLQLLGFDAKVEARQMDGDLVLDVVAEDSGRLIGRQGQILSELQYLLNRIVFQQDLQAPKVMVDVSGYRAAAREALILKAQAAAEKVRRFGDLVELEPLSAFDRRIVHSALRDDPDIITQSVEVDGTNKKAMLLRPRPL